MAIREREIREHHLIEAAKIFLLENWGAEVSMENILPAVLIQKSKWTNRAGRPLEIFPLVRAADIPIAENWVFGQTPRSTTDNRLLFMFNEKSGEVVVNLQDVKDKGRWDFSRIKNKGYFGIPAKKIGMLDSVWLQSQYLERVPSGNFSHFGSLEDKLSGKKVEVIVVRFAKIIPGNLGDYSKVVAIDWMRQMLRVRKIAELGDR